MSTLVPHFDLDSEQLADQRARAWKHGDEGRRQSAREFVADRTGLLPLPSPSSDALNMRPSGNGELLPQSKAETVPMVIAPLRSDYQSIISPGTEGEEQAARIS